MVLLNQKNLHHLSRDIQRPSFNRKIIKAGIVHIGVGGFHRSHQAFYINTLLEKNGETEWGICGIGLRKDDRKISEILNNQDYLYTLLIQHPNGQIDKMIIGSIVDYILAVDTPDLVIDKLAHSDTKIVSLTITEGGYNFNSSSGEFNFDNPDIIHDLEHPNQPKTVFGYLTAALKKRKKIGLQPFTILSCDNIQHNGNVTKKMLLAFSYRQDSDLADWIQSNVCFPNSMVDRITPTTKPVHSSYLKDEFGLIDDWPVVSEPFIQWVIEDNFCNGRPELEKLGVQFVSDVLPYEKMKIRLLNAGHSVLGIPGALIGYTTIEECMKDSVFRRFMRTFMDSEATPILDELKGVDLREYKDNLEERFSNPNIKDNVSRICSESSAKLPKFLIPTLLENLEKEGSIKYATFVLALWCYYCDKGVDENQNALNIIDEKKTELHKAASDTENDVLAFLKQADIFDNLFENERFTKLYAGMVQKIYSGISIKKLMNSILE